MKCISFGCPNHSHEGQFVGEVCKPCFTALTESVDNKLVSHTLTEGEILECAYNSWLITGRTVTVCCDWKAGLKHKWQPVSEEHFRLHLLLYTKTIIEKDKEKSLKVEKALLSLYDKLEYDGHGWWFPDKGLGEGEQRPSFEEFINKLQRM